VPVITILQKLVRSVYKSHHPITMCNNFALKLVMSSNTAACDNPLWMLAWSDVGFVIRLAENHYFSNRKWGWWEVNFSTLCEA